MNAAQLRGTAPLSPERRAELAAYRKRVKTLAAERKASKAIAKATASLTKRRRSSAVAFAPGSPGAVAAYLAELERDPFSPEVRERRDIESYLEASGLPVTAVASAMMLRDAWLAGDRTAHEPWRAFMRGVTEARRALEPPATSPDYGTKAKSGISRLPQGW